MHILLVTVGMRRNRLVTTSHQLRPQQGTIHILLEEHTPVMELGKQRQPDPVAIHILRRVQNRRQGTRRWFRLHRRWLCLQRKHHCRRLRLQRNQRR